MMCSFDVIGVLVEPLTQVGAPSPQKATLFRELIFEGLQPTKFGDQPQGASAVAAVRVGVT